MRRRAADEPPLLLPPVLEKLSPAAKLRCAARADGVRTAREISDLSVGRGHADDIVSRDTRQALPASLRSGGADSGTPGLVGSTNDP